LRDQFGYIRLSKETRKITTVPGAHVRGLAVRVLDGSVVLLLRVSERWRGCVAAWDEQTKIYEADDR